MPLAAGSKIGPYEILAAIGAGGMGAVYKARDTRLGRFVAIKVLPPDKVSDPDRKRRFIQEAKAASALSHPNIVTIYDIGSEGGADFIVMEFISGRPLHRVIPRNGMRLTDALDCAIPVAEALAIAHAAGIVHRDLKPANILLGDDGTVKLVDFGLAKLVENVAPRDLVETQALGETVTPLTEDGAILGTVSYMSPEQADGKPVDARSDLFSFGVVLYEMLTGRRAFQGDSRISTLAAILREEPKPPSECAPGLPHEIERLIGHCLRKDPAKRWQSMADLRTSLQEFKEDSNSGASRGTPTGTAQAPRRRVNLTWAVVAVLVVTGGLSAWFLGGRRGPAESLTRSVPLTSYPGTEDFPSFSPDGTQVAFAWDGEKQDNVDIYVKRIGPGPPLRLTTNPAADTAPAWSPDGKWIAFLRATRPGRANVVLIPPLGGPERVLSEAGLGGPPGQALTWSPDSKWLVIYNRPASEPGGLWLLSLDTGERRRLTTASEVTSSSGDFTPVFSPDGRTLAFTRARILTLDTDLYVLSLGDDLRPRGEPRRLTNEHQFACCPTWTADGRELVFTFGVQANLNLWRIPLQGAAHPHRLPELTNAFNPTISARTNRLAFVRLTADTDIYRVELSQDGREARGAMPLITSTRYDWRPVYSPDGKKIAFTSLRSGDWELWTSDSDGSNAIQMTSNERGTVDYAQWSPDGRQIGFLSSAEGPLQAYVIDAAGGMPRRFEALGPNVTNWRWSRDGRWIFFSAIRTGRSEVWRMPAGGGTPTQLTYQGGGGVIESPDGKLIYYSARGSVWSVPVEGGEEREVFSFEGNIVAIGISRIGMYFVANALYTRPGDLMFYRFPNGPVTKVTGVESPSLFGLSISPDGRYLLYSKNTSTGTDLMLVENYR